MQKCQFLAILTVQNVFWGLIFFSLKTTHKYETFLLNTKFIIAIKFVEKLAFQFLQETQIDSEVFLLQKWEFFPILTIKNVFFFKKKISTTNYAQICSFFVNIKIYICYSIFGEISILIFQTNTTFLSISNPE